MNTPKKVYSTDIREEGDNIYIKGELYGTATDFYTDVDAGKIEIDCSKDWQPEHDEL